MPGILNLFRFAVILLVGATLTARPVAAAVQEFPITPDPAACRIEPRPADDVIDIWFALKGSPVAAPRIPREAVGAAEVAIPVGTAADAATSEAIIATIAEVFACYAAGDYLRVLALYTDALVLDFGPGREATIEEARSLLAAAPESVPAGDMDMIAAVSDVMALADGRVGAFIVTQGEEGPDVAYVILARQVDRWLFDEDIHFSPGD